MNIPLILIKFSMILSFNAKGTMKRCLLALSLLSLWTLAMEGKKFLLVFVLWPRYIDLIHDLCRLSQTMRVAPLRGLPVVPGNLSGVQSRSFNTAGVSNYLTKLKPR